MRTSEFDYNLPPDYIAQTPIEPRDAARLMVVHRDTAEIEHRTFRDVVEYLHAGDLLVANDSRVIPARLKARKVPTGGRVEVLLLYPRDERTWEVLVGGATVRVGTVLEIIGEDGTRLRAEAIDILESGGRLLRFEGPISPLLESVGETPLPPYIHEPLEDSERYQTVYAQVQGSVAAPTAGLHFTPHLIQEIKERGVEFAFATLHIGLDTFRPVQVEQIQEHEMHSEYAVLPPEAAEAINRTREAGGRVIAVGTTVVRILESAAQISPAPEQELQPFSDWTDLFIYPGYKFQVVQALITNFHLPRSTLLMLVSAFAGKGLIFEAYHAAIEENYRFYSFGDAMYIV